MKRIILGKCVDGLKKSVDRRWISWRFYGKHFIQFVQTTSQSSIHFVNTAAHRLYMGQRELEPEPEVFIERRKIFAGFYERIEAGQTLAIEKYSTVYTSRDKEAEGKTLADIQEISLDACREAEKLGYGMLKNESAEKWKEEVWDQAPIQVKGPARRPCKSKA